MVAVHENYKDYQPPAYVARTVKRLLADVPPNYLAGLQSVVLTNASAIGRGKTGRVGGRKYARRECRGFYHPKWKNQPPWIEIVVDNLLAGILPSAKWIPPLRTLMIADVLFHEVGHHLDLTLVSPGRGGEAPANEWSKQLSRACFRKRYWYLVPILKPIWKAIGPWIYKWLDRKIAARRR